MIKAEMTSDDEGDQAMFGILLIFILIAAPLILTLITLMQLCRVITSVATRSCCKKEASADDANNNATAAGNDDGSSDSSVAEFRSQQSADRPPSFSTQGKIRAKSTVDNL